MMEKDIANKIYLKLKNAPRILICSSAFVNNYKEKNLKHVVLEHDNIITTIANGKKSKWFFNEWMRSI